MLNGVNGGNQRAVHIPMLGLAGCSSHKQPFGIRSMCSGES